MKLKSGAREYCKNSLRDERIITAPEQEPEDKEGTDTVMPTLIALSVQVNWNELSTVFSKKH